MLVLLLMMVVVTCELLVEMLWTLGDALSGMRSNQP